jgi:phage FluMu protein Com
MGWHRSELRPLGLLFSFCSRIQQPLLRTNCSTLLTEMSGSPALRKCWPRCLNLNAVNASQSQRICEAVSYACLLLPHLRMFASHSLNRYPLRWQCPFSNPVIIFSWFLLILRSFPFILAGSLLGKPLATFIHEWTASASRVSCLFSPSFLSWQPFVDMHTKTGWGPVSVCQGALPG